VTAYLERAGALQYRIWATDADKHREHQT
jgi:hypothetical protein